MATVPHSLTHEDLRKRAIQWLTNTCHCGVVLSEILAYTLGDEIPDAIGWKHTGSILVECKTSRADFHAQKNKTHVRSGLGVGMQRYYMVPHGLIQAKDLDAVGPEGIKESDWGLLWVSQHQVAVVKSAIPRDACKDDEIAMLVSALRRVRAREFLVIVPES
jgi:hypothetical protein